MIAAAATLSVHKSTSTGMMEKVDVLVLSLAQFTYFGCR